MTDHIFALDNDEEVRTENRGAPIYCELADELGDPLVDAQLIRGYMSIEKMMFMMHNILGIDTYTKPEGTQDNV